jgi:predicted phage-related endonuclease
MQVERREIKSREEWLTWRKSDVTASTVGALFGAHPYTTAMRLYAEKRGTEFLDEDNAAMRRGRWLEPAVAKAVEEVRPEWSLFTPGEYLRNAELRLGATPDFYIGGDMRGKGVLQAKTVAPSVYARDWNDGKEVPLWIILQAVTEGWLSNADFIVVAALLVDAHNMDVCIHELPRNPAAEERIRNAVIRFWHDVDAGIEPEPDFTRDADVIKAIWRKEKSDSEIDLSTNNILPGKLAERQFLKDQIKNAEATCASIEAEIKYLMKDAAVVTGLEEWHVTYKTSQFKTYTVPAREVRVLRIYDHREKSS